MYLNIGNVINNAAFFDPFDEGVPCAIVCDGESKGILRFCDLNLLRSPLAMGKYEVVQTNLSA